ncbi:pyrroloquinoline quinone biosynthesis protein PqqB [Planosporangium flavigriseum]|uniref:pyrroloquinoline quinone biosynthesis protein PqqB n=1 Tax=Planosporangium flavigriseum TaxID=373681 RepID=UPI00194EF386|nr:pyrroloquinoline quinone biosynthesis protein PqqB [Planosporangium flavigriseum]
MRVLGSAAGGGFPQWNCACRNCAGVRAGTVAARTRTQSSVAVSADRRRWLLVNATPDVGPQLAMAAPAGDGRVRARPVTAVLLTDAELDHVAGLLTLREGGGLVVYATAWILWAAAPILDILSAYVPVGRRQLPVGVDTLLTGASGLSCRPIAAGSAKLPRYVRGLPADATAVIGYRFTDAVGAILAYVPCLPELTDDIAAELKGSDCVFLDGTCWTDDELAVVGLPAKSARSMGHAPVTGPAGTLERFAALPTRRRIYTHLNNTNPLLVEDSVQRKRVEGYGIEVAYDGMEFELP